jgi:uncharacterized protein (DUF169 family)
MHFCRAVSVSKTGPLTLTQKDVNCPGARRSFGWRNGVISELVGTMVQQTGFPPSVAEKLIEETPRLENGRVAAVTVGDYKAPDILMAYLQPAQAMRLVLRWQQAYAGRLDATVSTVMSICGGIAAGTYLTGKVCTSFGCPASRKHGAISRDRMAIGIPATLLKSLL